MKTYEEMADSVFQRISDYQVKEKKRRKTRKKIGSVGAIILLSLAISLNIWNPSLARELPLIGGAFEYIQNRLTYAGLYSNYSHQVGETVTNNGIDITLSEVYCDGFYLYISFVVDGLNLSKELNSGDYSQFQLDYYGKCYIMAENKKRILTESGFWAGLEGEYIDEDTFVGEAILHLEDDAQFPDDFTLTMNLEAVGIIGDRQNMVSGTWKFCVDTVADRRDVVTYEIGAENKGYRIDKVVVTPIMVNIFTSYPEIDYEKDRLEILAYGKDPETPCQGSGVLYKTEAISRIPRKKINDFIDIYMVDYKMEKVSEPRAEETVKQHAIVSYHLALD